MGPKTLVVVASLLACPALATAQPAIAGVVTDPTGAPVAAVVVEARSPVLIEQARTTTTDAGGRFRIERLRPGIYRVTFTRTHFRPLERDGIELAGSFTTIVNASLTVGLLPETISVTPNVPAVDVQTTRQEITLGADVLRSIPAVRAYNALLVLIPGVVTNLNDVVTGPTSMSFPIHGGRTGEGRLTVDGLTVGSPPSGNAPTTYSFDTGTAAEVTFATAGARGEAETGGLVMNIVPRSGGNALHGSVFASSTSQRLQSSNLTDALRAQGVTAPTPLSGVYDVSGSLGGPMLKDRLWYFVSALAGGNTREVPNVFYNHNAGDATKWLYVPDLARPEYSDRTFEGLSGRVTWQAMPRHKVTGFWDVQTVCRTCTGATPGLQEPARVAPEAVGVLGRPLQVWQATWSSPATSHLLFEAGFGGTRFGVGNFERQPNPTRSLIRVVEQCASGCADNGNIPNLTYRSQDFSVAHAGSYLWKGSMSYIAGAHRLKVGYQHTLLTDDRTWYTNDQNLTYRLNNGVPNQLTQSISPWVNDARAAWQAVFVDEQWTAGRLTLQGALRFDRAWSWFPEQRQGPSRFLPKSIVIPPTRGVDSYKDLSPRMGVAYDVFGNGRTALRISVGRYLEGVGVTGNYANTNPTLRMAQTTPVFGTAGVTRAWADANRNFVPDCDLLNPGAQDLRAGGGDFCGVLSNTDFGSGELTNQFDPRLLRGWGVRPSDWNVGVSIQQQVAGAGIGVTFTRRSFAGFSVTDNALLSASDLTRFSIVAPSDPRLPGGGGYVVGDLYDVVPEKAGQISNVVADSDQYGTWRQRFSGVDVTVNLRDRKGLTLAGGTSTGQTVADACAVRAQLPELATTAIGTSAFGAGLNTSAITPLSPYCRVSSGVLTQVRGLGSYLVPEVGIQVSAAIQSKPGAMLAANYVVPNADVAPSLGRNLSGNAPSITVNLLAPGTRYGDRINQLDCRIAKIFRYRGARLMVAGDIYNALNSSAVLTYNSAFIPGGPWLQPSSILTARFLKLTAEITF
jgi:hypothetical protein